MLKYIMHNWPDEQATQILRSCWEATAPGGRVLIMDPALPPGDTPHTSKLMDVL
ncbi:methyltransferase [Brevibacillus brevis]|uniref:methyltransferase n=1 Tax=Brevibacillus brevis TaxID=1393 RepID=UPI003AFFF397